MMKRRNFLGLMGGAVASGPKLAQGLAQEATNNGALTTGRIGALVDPTPEKAVRDEWIPNRIAELRRILSGQDDESAKDRRLNLLLRSEQVERFRLDSLRSISPVHKVRMFIAGDLDRAERVNRLHMERELDSLLNFSNR